MNLDQGRKYDLDEMWKDYQDTKSIYKKREIEKAMSQILYESKANVKIRDELIRAVRAGDVNRATYIRTEMRKQQADKVNNNIQL